MFTIGGYVSGRHELVRTEEIAIYLGQIRAYPNGFAFELDIWEQPRPSDDDEDWDRHDRWSATHGSWRRKHAAGDPIPPEVFCFGVEFADGSKATNLDDRVDFYDEDEDFEPQSPLLSERGGSGGMFHMTHGFWVWPLPPEGTVAFVAEWPAKGIDITRFELDAVPIIAAGAEAEQLFVPMPGTYNFIE